MGPIPWTAIHEYAGAYGFIDDEIDYDDFVFIISALDEEFLKITRKTAEDNARRRGARRPTSS